MGLVDQCLHPLGPREVTRGDVRELTTVGAIAISQVAHLSTLAPTAARKAPPSLEGHR